MVFDAGGLHPNRFDNEQNWMKHLFLLVLCFDIVENPIPAFSQDKRVVGWLETVKLCSEDLTFTAKLNTGAKT